MAGAVQLLQRGSISVVDVEVANTAYREYTDPSISQLEADIRSLGRTHYPLQVETLRRYTEWTSEVNAELLAGLERAGMKLDLGEDGTGWLMKFHRYAGGYYLNVGASEFVVSGDIGLVPFESVEKFVPTGVLTTDGVLHELDLVVLATGYENLSVEVEHLFGHEVADRVGRIGGFGPDGERRNFGRPTAQPNLWFMLGGIAEGRRAGSALALQLAANVMGVAPTVVRGPDGRVVPLAPGEVASGGGDVPVA